MTRAEQAMLDAAILRELLAEVRAQRDQARAAIERLLSLAGECEHCDGRGVWSGDACPRCGGVGERCEAGPELAALREAIR